MSTTPVNASLLTASLAGILWAGRLVVWPLANVAIPRRVDTVALVTAQPPVAHPDSLAVRLIGHDPFRVSRRPSPIAYDPARLAPPATPQPPKPVLALVGIVWDRESDPTALLDGLPGVDGPRPMRLGEVVGGLRVKSIKPDRVVITGLDTTWTLTVREPWR